MHAIHTGPRQPLAAGLLALTLALLVLLVVGGEPGTWDFSVGGGGSTASAGSAAPAPPAPTPLTEPTWVADPLAPPFPAR
jgi:hypothetical protein